jgi:adenosylcobinamide amidohydrolase
LVAGHSIMMKIKLKKNNHNSIHLKKKYYYINKSIPKDFKESVNKSEFKLSCDKYPLKTVVEAERGGK